jgi:flagellar basal-body rod modification protein FlgD
MTTVNTTQSALSAASSASSQSRAAQSSKTIADNFDQFLTLLTTQLKNQSPLDPLDTNQFTQQLVQFAGVEQQISTNKSLEALVAANKNSSLLNALGFVGANVTADGKRSQLKNGSATWQLDAPRNGTAQIIIKDKNGATVFTSEQALNGGSQSFVWNGRQTNGGTAADGEYSIEITATDASRQSMVVRTETTGVVDSVDLTGSEPILKIGAISIPMSDVRTIRRN